LRNKYALYLLMVVIAIIIAGCVKKESMPSEMPNDFHFIVQFGVESKNEINTFEDTVTKDLVADGTITRKIPLTKKELKQVYEKMKEINIAEPKKLEPKRKSCQQIPYGEDKWNIQFNGDTISLYLSEEYCNPTKDAKQLIELRDYIYGIVSKKEEYKKLPESQGGYR
jgi:hypothetical protein